MTVAMPMAVCGFMVVDVCAAAVAATAVRYGAKKASVKMGEEKVIRACVVSYYLGR